MNIAKSIPILVISLTLSPQSFSSTDVCHLFIDKLDKIAVYDSIETEDYLHTTKALWDAFQRTRVENWRDANSLSAEFQIPIKGVMTDWGFSHTDDDWQEFREEVNQSRFSYSDTKLFQSTNTKRINDGIQTAINTCVQKSGNGLFIYPILNQEPRVFFLKITFKPFLKSVSLENLTIDIEPSDAATIADGGPINIERDTDRLLKFERTKNVPLVIRVRPSGEQIFSERTILVPPVLEAERYYDNLVRIETNLNIVTTDDPIAPYVRYEKLTGGGASISKAYLSDRHYAWAKLDSTDALEVGLGFTPTAGPRVHRKKTTTNTGTEIEVSYNESGRTFWVRAEKVWQVRWVPKDIDDED